MSIMGGLWGLETGRRRWVGGTSCGLRGCDLGREREMDHRRRWVGWRSRRVEAGRWVGFCQGDSSRMRAWVMRPSDGGRLLALWRTSASVAGQLLRPGC